MSIKTDTFYNKFSFVYPLVDHFLKPQKKVLLAEVNALPEGRLLEIGVGNGAHFPLYNRHSVTGIDTSTAMLKLARKKAAENIKVLKMNGESLLFPAGTFDYVVLSHVIAVEDDPKRLLTEVLRVLKDGGRVLILNHFTPNNWLRRVDGVFSIFSKVLHFRSVFFIGDVATTENFTLIKQVDLGFASYFKLLIYQKK